MRPATSTGKALGKASGLGQGFFRPGQGTLATASSMTVCSSPRNLLCGCDSLERPGKQIPRRTNGKLSKAGRAFPEPQPIHVQPTACPATSGIAFRVRNAAEAGRWVPGPEPSAIFPMTISKAEAITPAIIIRRDVGIIRGGRVHLQKAVIEGAHGFIGKNPGVGRIRAGQIVRLAIQPPLTTKISRQDAFHLTG